VYSPDDDEPYFLERREPGNWAYSAQSFASQDEAETAYRNGKIEWVLD